MLTRLIVDIYAFSIEMALWIILFLSGIFGYHYTVPMLNGAGYILEDEAVWKILGTIFFPTTTFLFLAALIGPFLVLFDIRKSVKALEARNNSNNNILFPVELTNNSKENPENFDF